MAILLADDKSKVRIGMIERDEKEETILAYHDFDAAGLSNYISHLANYRAQMADVVTPSFEPGKINISTEVNPASYVGNEGKFSKRFILALRHPGYGWLGFGFNEANGRVVTGLMMVEVMRMGELPTGLISPSGRKL